MNEILKESLNISSEESLKETAKAFNEPGKFQGINFKNETGYWEIGQIFYEGWDNDGDIPSGFQNRTGVTVGGLNVQPNSQHSSNVQSQVKVQANLVQCGLTNLVHHRTGQEISQYRLKDMVAPAGYFFTRSTFGIRDGKKSKNDNSFEIVAEYHLNNGDILFEQHSVEVK